MAEKLIHVDVGKSVEEVIEASVGAINTEKAPKKNRAAAKKDDHSRIVEALLRGVATRIVLTHSFKDLGKTLSDTVALVKAGSMDAEKIDLLKGGVIDAVKKIKDGREGEAISRFLDEHFKQGKYEEAAEFLKKMAEDPETGLLPAEKLETVDVLGKVKKQSSTTTIELQELFLKNEEIRLSNQNKTKALIEKSDEIQTNIGREEVRVLIENKDPKDVVTDRTTNSTKRNQILDEISAMSDFDVADAKFIEQVLIGEKGSGNKAVDFMKMDRKLAYHIWYRTSGILGRDDWTGGDKTMAMLTEMNESARRALLELATKNLVLEGMSPSEARWLSLPSEERDLINSNLEHIQNIHGDFRELLQAQDQGYPGESFTRTDASMMQLISEYAKKNPDFHLEQKLRRNEDTNNWEWFGTREELFDVCREEVYGIQGQLTQENMGNLIFEESAQKYLALMRIDVGDDLELERVKDVITKTLYIEFAVKTMWRSGGNMEGWQRAASVLAQDSEENFFQLMQLGETLKVKDSKGNVMEVGRFNWEDLMSLAEMKAENGQYYLTYLSGQSTALRGERKKEFVAALADVLVKKRILKGELTHAEASQMMVDVQRGNFEFTDRQVRSMVDYMQFLEVATFRGGEFGLNDSIIPGKFNLVSLPCGELVHKAGPWSIIYYWHYPVTKYGGEWVGKLFLPNVNILSYRRGETLAHFIAKDSKIAAGMLDKAGNYHETGVGALDYFFDGINGGDAESFADFWGDVIFDTRTGEVTNKTAINRTVEAIRETGSNKLVEWQNAGRLGFVNNINFGKFETMLGYRIPGGSKLDKLKWMTENFDYSFWRKDIIPSKGVGDWVGKYVPKKYEEARLKLMAFLNSPGTATLGALRDIISEYSDESTFNKQAQAALKGNRKFSLGWRMVDKKGHEEGTEGYDSSTGKRKLVGYKHADRGLSKWVSSPGEEGDHWEVTEQWHSPTEGLHLGSGFAMSRQQGKELFRDPMYFEKLEIDNQFHAGMMSRKEWGEQKREFQMRAYLGDKIGDSDFRLGYIPFLTPLFLFRGWWVDKMQLDWEDFMIIMHKNNEETWTKLKKILGL